MAERLTITTDQLTDVTERVQCQLNELSQSEDSFVLEPRGLYLRHPGIKLHGESFVDAGCSGGHREYFDVYTDEEPVRVNGIKKQYPGAPLQFKLAKDYVNHYQTLPPQDWQHAQYFEAPPSPEARVSPLVNNAMHQLLSAHDFTRLDRTRLSARFGPFISVFARPAHPLDHPITMEMARQDDDYALNGPLDTIESYFDHASNQHLARVIRGNPSSRVRVSTRWHPLDTFEFYKHELPHDAPLQSRLAEVARLLIDGERHIAPINQLLDSEPVKYTLTHAIQLHRARADYVIALLDKQSKFLSTLAPRLDHNSTSSHLQADRVVLHQEYPWVVDAKHRLATPLVDAYGFSPRNPGAFDNAAHILSNSSELRSARVNTKPPR